MLCRVQFVYNWDTACRVAVSTDRPWTARLECTGYVLGHTSRCKSCVVLCLRKMFDMLDELTYTAVHHPAKDRIMPLSHLATLRSPCRPTARTVVARIRARQAALHSLARALRAA